MPAKRRKFNPQLKAEAVQMVVRTGRTVAEVARVQTLLSELLLAQV